MKVKKINFFNGFISVIFSLNLTAIIADLSSVYNIVIAIFKNNLQEANLSKCVWQLENGEKFSVEMSEMLYNILMCCQTDLNDGLMQVKRYLENSSKRKTTTILTVDIIKAISTLVSTIHSLEHPDSEYMEIILDTLLFATRNTIREHGRIEFELENLTLKILTCIERNVKFHILFCKLLSLSNLMFSRSINVWQLLARPVFNLFINKRVEHAYLEEALKEFNNISKKLKPSELVSNIKQNHNISQGFSMLVREYGDFVIQMNILELLFLFTGHDRNLMKSLICCGNQEISELLEKLHFSDFGKDSRIFLNAFNKSLGLGKKVFSLHTSVFYLGNAKLSPPSGAEGIWIDLNQDSQRISIFYADFLPNSRSPHSGILHLPVKEVEMIKLKFSKLSGEDCCCVIMKIRITSEMYHFTEGSEVICKAFLSLDQRKSVAEFVRAVEELSDNVQAHEKMKTNEISNSGSSLTENSTAGQIKSPPRKSNRIKISISSPIIFVTGDKKEDEDMRGSSQMTYASSILSVKEELNTNESFCSNINSKTDRNWSAEKIYNRITLSGESNLQVNQISSSVFESQKLVLSSGFNPSLSLQASTKNDKICNKWRVPDDVQLDISNSKKGVNCTLSSDVQDLQENYPHYVSCKTYGDNPEKYEETNQIKKNYSRRIYEEWANSEDSFSSEFCLIKEKNKENVEYSGNRTAKVSSPAPTEKKPADNASKLKLMYQHKQSKLRDRVKTDEIRSTSLLDPNGYSYKRWQLQTTSERSNFWLNKLKETENKASKPLKDIFNFSDEEDHSDGSNVFRKKKIGKGKKSVLTRNKTKSKNEKKAGTKAKDDKLLKNNARKTVETESDFRSKTNVSQKSKIGNKKMSKTDEEVMQTIPDTKACMDDIGDEFIQTRDLPLGELHGNIPSKRFSSDNCGKVVINQKLMGESEKENEVAEEKPKRRKHYVDESFLPSARKTKQSAKPISFDVQLKEIESEMWNNMYQFFKETRKREEKELAKYFKTMEEIMKRLTEEEEEVKKRLTRFDKCVEYLNLGTSLCEINEESQKGMENVLERLNMVDRSGKTESRMNRFLQDAEEKLISKVENYIYKKFREFNLSLLERYLSNNAL